MKVTDIRVHVLKSPLAGLDDELFLRIQGLLGTTFAAGSAIVPQGQKCAGRAGCAAPGFHHGHQCHGMACAVPCKRIRENP